LWQKNLYSPGFVGVKLIFVLPHPHLLALTLMDSSAIVKL